jgi:hypothetical protein
MAAAMRNSRPQIDPEPDDTDRRDLRLWRVTSFRSQRRYVIADYEMLIPWPSVRADSRRSNSYEPSAPYETS